MRELEWKYIKRAIKYMLVATAVLMNDIRVHSKRLTNENNHQTAVRVYSFCSSMLLPLSCMVRPSEGRF